MNLILIGAIVFVIIALIYKVIGKGGKEIVYTEIYEVQGDSYIRLNPKFATKALIKKVDNTYKLFLPKKYTDGVKFGIETPKYSEYIVNSKGIKLIKVVKLSQGAFKLMIPDIKIDKTNASHSFKVIDRDISFWADNELLRIHQDYNVETRWDKVKPYVALGVVAVVCLLMIYCTLDKAGEILSDAAGESRETTSIITKFIDNPTDIANYINNKDKESVTTNATKPPITK